MIIHRPKNPSGLLLVCDVRSKFDREVAEETGGSPVLDKWRFGRQVYGDRDWSRVTRICLFDYGQDINALRPEQAAHVRQAPEKRRTALGKRIVSDNRAQARSDLREFLREEQFPVTMILEAPNAQDQGKDSDNVAKNKKGTFCWTALAAPDSLSNMSGTVWASEFGQVMPLLYPRYNGSYVWNAEIRKWMLGARELVAGRMQVLTPGGKGASEPGPALETELRDILARHSAGVPLALDLETFTDEDLITCIGLSTGAHSASVPWDTFRPFGTDTMESGASPACDRLVRDILNVPVPKITHNGIDFDIPFLRRRGVSVNGKVLDTYLMHGVVHKQLRHGLQRACTTYNLVPPWKSLHKAAGQNDNGLTEDDGEYWIQNPKELRGYNLEDSFQTWHLGAALRPKVGV